MNVSQIRTLFKNKFLNKEFCSPKGEQTIEIINACFEADEPSIFGKPNEDYIARELEWYLLQSLNIKDIPGVTPKIWENVADDQGYINSNYGYLVFNDGNYSQYNNCLETLKKDPESRRAIIIYTRPNIQHEYNKNGRSDFICTNTVQYLIRNKVLNTIVTMRSNDAIFGYANDLAWQTYIRDKLSSDLSLDSEILKGKIYWNVGSLHLYERHFRYVE